MSIQGNVNKIIGVGVAAEKMTQARIYRQSALERSAARREAANKRAQDLIANKEAQRQERKKRRNFMEYLRKQPVSLGGTVGDYPIEFQKKTAQAYTPYQRKKMMDYMDEEAKSRGKK